MLLLNLRCITQFFEYLGFYFSLQVISSALSALPILLSSIEDMGFNAKCSHDQLITMAKQANAALAALGGFEETVKPGCEVEVSTDH